MLSLFVFLVALSSIVNGSVLYRDRYGNLVRYEADNDELSVYQRGQKKLGNLLDNLEEHQHQQVPASNSDQNQQELLAHELNRKKDNYSPKKSPLSKFKDLAEGTKKELTLPSEHKKDQSKKEAARPPSDQSKKVPATSDQSKKVPATFDQSKKVPTDQLKKEKVVADNKKKVEEKKYVASLFDDEEVKDSVRSEKKDAELKKKVQEYNGPPGKRETGKEPSTEKKDSLEVKETPAKKDNVQSKDAELKKKVQEYDAPPGKRDTPAKEDSVRSEKEVTAARKDDTPDRKQEKSSMDEKLEKTRLETIKLIQMADSKNLKKMDKLFKDLFNSASDQEKNQRKSLKQDFTKFNDFLRPRPTGHDGLSNRAQQQKQLSDYEAFNRYLQNKRQQEYRDFIQQQRASNQKDPSFYSFNTYRN